MTSRLCVRVLLVELTMACVRVVLSIAGSDPTGGAGLQLDLQVLRALGVHGAAVVTALTVQDRRKVHRVLPVFPSLVLEQIRAVARDLPLAVVKLGMLASDDVARAVLHGLEEIARADSPALLVVDPVLAASDGTPLLERRALPVLREIIARANLVTPNLAEATELTGCDARTQRGAEAAVRVLVTEFGARAALIKGGHREGAPDDLLAQRCGDTVELLWLAGERSHGSSLRGTGCALASAIAARLAQGDDLRAAVQKAREFVAEAIRRAHARGPEVCFLEFP